MGSRSCLRRRAGNHPGDPNNSDGTGVHLVTLPKQPTTILLVLAALLSGVLVYSYGDWFHRHPIQITHRFHAFGGRFDTGGVAPLMFEFNAKLKLTSVKVVVLGDPSTNSTAHTLWHMVSDSNSVPTRGFLYGMDIPGMRPSLSGVIAEPLDPTQKYRLLIEAGSIKAQHDFDLAAAASGS